MMTEARSPEADELSGYTTTVHRSLLVVVRWGEVPKQLALSNLVLGFIIICTFQIWQFFVVSGIIHAVLWIMTKKDAKRLETIVRYLRYRRYYPPR